MAHDNDQGYWRALTAMRMAGQVAQRHRAAWVLQHCMPYPGRKDSPKVYMRINAQARAAFVVLKSETELGIL